MTQLMIDHPSHYNVEGKKECIEQMLEDYGPVITGIFCLTNAYKYSYRCGHKDDVEQELGKIEWYLNYYKRIELMIRQKNDILLLSDSMYSDIIRLHDEVTTKYSELRRMYESKS